MFALEGAVASQLIVMIVLDLLEISLIHVCRKKSMSPTRST